MDFLLISKVANRLRSFHLRHTIPSFGYRSHSRLKQRHRLDYDYPIEFALKFNFFVISPLEILRIRSIQFRLHYEKFLHSCASPQ